MKVVVAIDTFKGSMSSMEAGYAAATGILRADPAAQVIVRPLADGGEGTLDALVRGLAGEKEAVWVTGPLGDPVTCEYGIIGEEKRNPEEAPGDEMAGLTGIIEIAAAAGITLVPHESLNPMRATTYGIGETIRDAIKKGCRRFLVGLGGSATNDGGIGMLQALGFGFLDRDGRQIPQGAAGLEQLERITDDGVLPELAECTFRVACDVNNPLCGEKGSTAVFGPQKGVTPEQIPVIDGWMSRYAALARDKYPGTDPWLAGSGAAGGLGFAFQTFLHAKLESGVRLVQEETKLEQFVRSADIVVTGEGRMDRQTAYGKAPIGVAQLAKKHSKAVVAFAGTVSEDGTECNRHGIDAIFPIVRQAQPLKELMRPETAKKNMTAAAEQAFRMMAIGMKLQ